VRGSQGVVLIVDADAVHRRQLARVLRDGGFSSEEAASAEEALELVKRIPPQLALLEIKLPGMCGYELLRRLRDGFGDGFPIVFTSGDRTESFDRVAGMMIGADDYFAKPISADELLARIRRLLRSSRSERATNGGALTTREREVLGLLAAGKSQREIADALVIAPKTCGKHIERILEKLGVHSRAQAVAVAYREQLVPLPA
jgi:two-component system, NarL family, nitrate/nitrite response regulator NarL